MEFYVGLHQPSNAQHFDRCMVSVNRLRDRRSDIPARVWMLDSGAFTEIATHGGYRDEPEVYARQVARWATCGQLVAAVSQDYMCEPFILARTGLDVATHQRLTIERYDALRTLVGDAAYVLPVLQGFQPSEYVDHLRQYGERLRPGQWVGVGSVCKRNANPNAVAAVLLAIAGERPDLKLHGFGVKKTSLTSDLIRSLLHSADSLAWSYNARRNGRDANDWREAQAFADAIARQQPRQHAYQWGFDL
jgi:hypothetical protein